LSKPNVGFQFYKLNVNKYEWKSARKKIWELRGWLYWYGRNTL